MNPQTIRNWIDRGELRAIRVALRRIRVRRADLDDFIAAGTAAGTTARLSQSEAGADQAEEISTSQALAELRSQLEAVGRERDPLSVAEALAAIAESARTLADRLKQKASSA